MDFLTPLPSGWLRQAGLILAAALMPTSAGAESEAVESAIKATYLYKFANYVDWPAKAFASPTAPVKLCITGKDPFGPTLDTAISGQRIAEREMVVLRLKNVGPNSGCHILFVGDTDSGHSAQTLAAVHGSPTLTVTDNRESSGGAGVGMINFVVKDNRVRFEIAPEAASESGIALSSKLLALAINLKPYASPESH